METRLPLFMFPFSAPGVTSIDSFAPLQALVVIGIVKYSSTARNCYWHIYLQWQNSKLSTDTDHSHMARCALKCILRCCPSEQVRRSKLIDIKSSIEIARGLSVTLCVHLEAIVNNNMAICGDLYVEIVVSNVFQFKRMKQCR